ncbi:FAD-dependent oxidoreductase [Pseudomonas sp. YY-1]|uniref:NAD(P)/FAD-dependent oxidoreductase n=1 Tax=Pseudomonas sp. YY-1 TaxID=2058659 RepID=UPI000CB2FE49|nr:FAD-dependent oxidoreductase [Pseudomonas sp. YY-1]MCW1935852.1 FAD-dependent oxidoreductase [Pseudomonas sp. MDMC_285]PKQ39251.1 FAD-dependent oxidoreductase [Pseudomonas sp. YY-1]
MPNTQDHSGPEVIIIGAGIVGLCTAYQLLETGKRVTIVDPSQPGAECSSGNAGSLASGAVAPLAMPGVLKQAPGMLLDPTGPLYVPLSYLLHVAPWMARFVAASSPARVAEIALALHALIGDAVQLHKAMATQVGCRELIADSGQLHLYPDQSSLEKDNAGWALKQQHGLNAQRIGRADIHALEPAVSDHYQVGYHLPDQPWVKEPQLYASSIAEYLKGRGVQFVRDRVRGLSKDSRGWSLQGQFDEYCTAQVVLAAGAWSAQLLRPLGVKVPLETQRGYHLRFAKSEVALERIVVLADRKVFITSMQSGLRVAGTVEFGGLERPPSHPRAALLADHAKAGLPDLDVSNPVEWMGHRPCLPDSLPVIGEVPQQPGLWCAFGHGHLGLTGSAGTGRLLAQAMSGSALAQKAITPFSINRF